MAAETDAGGGGSAGYLVDVAVGRGYLGGALWAAVGREGNEFVDAREDTGFGGVQALD